MAKLFRASPTSRVPFSAVRARDRRKGQKPKRNGRGRRRQRAHNGRYSSRTVYLLCLRVCVCIYTYMYRRTYVYRVRAAERPMIVSKSNLPAPVGRPAAPTARSGNIRPRTRIALGLLLRLNGKKFEESSPSRPENNRLAAGRKNRATWSRERPGFAENAVGTSARQECSPS